MTPTTTLVVLDLLGVLVLGLSGATVWRDWHAPVAPQRRAGQR